MTTILAYFDPSAGSLLMQTVLGGGAGLIVFMRYVWSKALPRFSSPVSDIDSATQHHTSPQQ